MRSTCLDSRLTPLMRRAPRIALAAALCCMSASVAGVAQELSPLPRLTSAGVVDRSAEGLVEVRWKLPSEPVYPGQRAVLGLAIDIDEQFLEARMIQLFTRRLDVPIAVDEPQLAELVHSGFGPVNPDSDTAQIALGERVLRATMRADLDKGTRSLRLVTEVQADRPGSFELPAPVVRFATAESFRDDLLGRTPVDPRLAFVAGAESVLHIEAFPEAGRQPDFNGALGRFRIAASTDADVLQVGDVLHLQVVIEGELPEDDADLPRLDRWRGLHLMSMRVSRETGGAVIDAELRVERATVREVPSIEFHSFDPDGAIYRVASSGAIPLRVIADSATVPVEDAARRPSPWLLWPIAGAALGLVILLYRRRRARIRARMT